MRSFQRVAFLVPCLLADFLSPVLGAQRTSIVSTGALRSLSMEKMDTSLRRGVASQASMGVPAPDLRSSRSMLNTTGNYDTARIQATMQLALVAFEEVWPTHVFGDPQHREPSEMGFFGEHDRIDWIALGVATVTMVLLDIKVIQPRNKPTSGMSNAGQVLFLWLSCGLLFNVYICWRHGIQDGMHWCNGYLLEWLLSMDNLFVFHLVFHLYKTPEHLLHKALFWGILGAILFRMLFFITLNELLHVIQWFHYVFGFFLVVSGVQAAREEEDVDLENSYQVRFLRWLLQNRLMKDPNYEPNGRLWCWKAEESDGTGDTDSTSRAKLQISMIVPVIICLEITDIFFAVDSVSAKVAQIPDQYVAYSSSVFAMFGLRALFFIVEDLINRLHLLKYGLCFILVFIGFELLLSDYMRLPASAVCLVLMGVFGSCVVLSLLFPPKHEIDENVQ